MVNSAHPVNAPSKIANRTIGLLDALERLLGMRVEVLALVHLILRESEETRGVFWLPSAK
jgi:hypothetical protein